METILLVLLSTISGIISLYILSLFLSTNGVDIVKLSVIVVVFHVLLLLGIPYVPELLFYFTFVFVLGVDAFPALFLVVFYRLIQIGILMPFLLGFLL